MEDTVISQRLRRRIYTITRPIQIPNKQSIFNVTFLTDRRLRVAVQIVNKVIGEGINEVTKGHQVVALRQFLCEAVVLRSRWNVLLSHSSRVDIILSSLHKLERQNNIYLIKLLLTHWP